MNILLVMYTYTKFNPSLHLKELPWVNWTYDPVEDKKSQLISFSAILLEFRSILAKFYKNLHIAE